MSLLTERVAGRVGRPCVMAAGVRVLAIGELMNFLSAHEHSLVARVTGGSGASRAACTTPAAVGRDAVDGAHFAIGAGSTDGGGYGGGGLSGLLDLLPHDLTDELEGQSLAVGQVIRYFVMGVLKTFVGRLVVCGQFDSGEQEFRH